MAALTIKQVRIPCKKWVMHDLKTTNSRLCIGKDRQPILIERDQNFLHHIAEEDKLVTVSIVCDVLRNDFGGRVEKQEELVDALASKRSCSKRTAQRAIKEAVKKNAIEEVAGPRRAKGYRIV